jgi:hypothetical protein
MRRIILTVLGALFAIGAVGIGASAGTTRTAARTPDDPVWVTLSVARQATERYRDVSQATKDGYHPVSACVMSPDGGVMGIHYLNDAYAKDPSIRVAEAGASALRTARGRDAEARRRRVLAGRRRPGSVDRLRPADPGPHSLQRADGRARPRHAPALRPARLGLGLEPRRRLRPVQPQPPLLRRRDHDVQAHLRARASARLGLREPGAPSPGRGRMRNGAPLVAIQEGAPFARSTLWERADIDQVRRERRDSNPRPPA